MKKNILKNYICCVCHTKQKPFFIYRNFLYAKCPVCFLVSTYPFPTSKIIVEHYHEKFKTGNYHLFQDFKEIYNQVYQDFANLLQKYLATKKQKLAKKKVLDIGCFTGDFLSILQQNKADVHGVELQKEAVIIANKKLGGKKVLRKDIMSDAFPSTTYDIITVIGVIEHVTDPVLLLHNCSKRLKKNGTIMIQTPNSSSFFAQILKQYWPPYAPVEHIHLFSKKSLMTALSQAGFTDIVYQQSWKKLSIAYVFLMFQNFGPEFYTLFKPLQGLFLSLKHFVIPFYGGEMVIIARKQ
jgi:2-polyprenyl-3-methyl-5-hydroxy-6-metoxy-1,4-benzoquinol methylase